MTEILDSNSTSINYLKSFYIATREGLGELLSRALQTESTDWATLLTDIIAISAALGALALPISLSVIEATRSRYKSPTLLSIYTEISKTDPQKINRLLFGTLTFSLILKLTIFSKIIDFSYLLPLIFVLVIFFSVTILKLYRHLRFTYLLMSNINNIRDDLLKRIENSIPDVPAEPNDTAKNKKPKRKRKLEKYSPEVTAALMEIETYDICSTPSKRDIEKRLRNILYIQSSNVSDPRSEAFMQDILGAFPRMMAETETSREIDIYQSISGLYLYLISKTVIASSKFSHHLDEAIRISRFREQSLPPYGQFCGNGHIFLSCFFIKKPRRDSYAKLFDHFKKLLWNAQHKTPENIPSILSGADNLLLGTGYDEDPSYIFHYNIDGLWEYKKGRDITNLIKSCVNRKITIEELEHKLLTEIKPAIHEFTTQRTPNIDIEKLEKDITDTIDTIVTSIASKEISDAIEIETLQTLGQLLEKNPDVIIKCRESKNPAGAKSFNIGRPIVPSSLSACINALIQEKHFMLNFSIEETLEFKIVDAIGVLIVYELWKDFIFSTPIRKQDEYINSLRIPDCSIRESKSAHNRVEILEKSFEKILSNRIVSEKLNLLEEQKEFLRSLTKMLCEALKEKTSQTTQNKIRNNPLDPEQLDRYRSEIVNGWKDSQALLLFKQVRLCKCKSFTFKLNSPRESFLADTNVHYEFNGIGRNLLETYVANLVNRLMQRKGLDPSTSSPSPSGSMILLSRTALKKLEKDGYTYENGKLIWPSKKHEVPFYHINSKTSLYYNVCKDEKILDVNFGDNTEGYPMTIGHNDNNEIEIETFIRFNFDLAENLSLET